MYGQSYFRLVTMKIPGIAGGNPGAQFSFVDQADIRFARVLALEVFFAEDLTHAQPEQTANIPGAFASKCSLVLETNDPDDINGKKMTSPGRFTSTTQTQKWLPLTAIHRVQAGNQAATNASFVRQLLMYKDLYVIWQKSFLQVSGGGFMNTTDLALCLGVWYTFIDIHGKPIERQ